MDSRHEQQSKRPVQTGEHVSYTSCMEIDRIIRDIEAEIARLQAARDALLGKSGRASNARHRGKRAWSAAARKRQAEMMRARWVAKKKRKS